MPTLALPWQQQGAPVKLRDVDLLVFDWDGTVVDSTSTITGAIQQACEDIGLPRPSDEDASYVIGLGLQDALCRVAPGVSPDQIHALTARFRIHYLAQDRFLRLLPGMRQLLQVLHQSSIPLAVATGKSRAGLERAFDATETRSLFVDSRCADESVPKPGPEMVLELCESLQVSPSRVLVIGDTTHDLQMARAAGARAVAVTYGAHPPEALQAESPLGLMANVPELWSFLLSKPLPAELTLLQKDSP